MPNILRWLLGAIFRNQTNNSDSEHQQEQQGSPSVPIPVIDAESARIVGAENVLSELAGSQVSAYLRLEKRFNLRGDMQIEARPVSVSQGKPISVDPRNMTEAAVNVDSGEGGRSFTARSNRYT